jgi:hypothetical protein
MDRNSKEFKDLQRKWYAKAKKSGYEDIEQADGNLKVWHSRLFQINANDITGEAKKEYYRLAGQFLHAHKFENKGDKIMWELHAGGMSVRDIAKELKRLGFKTSRNRVHKKDSVHDKIQALVRIMKCQIEESQS